VFLRESGESLQGIFSGPSASMQLDLAHVRDQRQRMLRELGLKLVVLEPRLFVLPASKLALASFKSACARQEPMDTDSQLSRS